MPAIAEAFGKEFVTPEGALDRDRMRALVFSDPSAKVRLKPSSILWSEWRHRRKRKRYRSRAHTFSL
jgi:dephospho-CoA kinase